jgi:hypothetical protein
VFIPSSGSGENIRNWDIPAYIGIAQAGSDPIRKESLGRNVIG